MKNAAHILLWMAAIVAVVFVVITDDFDWWADNWLTILLFGGLILLALLTGIQIGKEEGAKEYSKKIHGRVDWK